jgi:DNA polymerase III alpha subunit
MSNIKSVKSIGKYQTYDLEIPHSDHQFYLANGVLTSNSHATAYAIDSYWCAYLLTHHEEEWLCAYLESMSTTPDKRAKAFSEVKALGYQIVDIDINYATGTWTVLPGKKLMPSINSCKGVGDAAVEEIMQFRPYRTLEEMLWNEDGSWRHSKFNKRAFETLIKIGAFQSLDIVGEGKLFKNYHHMHETIFGVHKEEITKKRKGVVATVEEEIEHFELIKKSTKTNSREGVDNFYNLVKQCENVLPWTKVEQAQNAIDVFGVVDILSLVNQNTITALNNKNVKSVESLENVNDCDIVWFVSIPIEGKNNFR